MSKTRKLTLSVDEFTFNLIQNNPEINVSGLVRWAMPIMVKAMRSVEDELVNATKRIYHPENK